MLLKARARALEGVRRLALRQGHSVKEDKRITQLYHPHVYRAELLRVVHANAGVIDDALDLVGVIVVRLNGQGQKPSGIVTKEKPHVLGQGHVRRSGRPDEDIRKIKVITEWRGDCRRVVVDARLAAIVDGVRPKHEMVHMI